MYQDYPRWTPKATIAFTTIIEIHGFNLEKKFSLEKEILILLFLQKRLIYHQYYLWKSSSSEVIADGCFTIPSLLQTRIWSNPLFLSIRFTEFQIWNLWECFLVQRMRSMSLVFIPLLGEVLFMEPRFAPFFDHVNLNSLLFWTA